MLSVHVILQLSENILCWIKVELASDISNVHLLSAAARDVLTAQSWMAISVVPKCVQWLAEGPIVVIVIPIVRR